MYRDEKGKDDGSYFHIITSGVLGRALLLCAARRACLDHGSRSGLAGLDGKRYLPYRTLDGRPARAYGSIMAHLKTISYIDAIEKQVRADNLTDHASVLEVVEAEHNEMIDELNQLQKRVTAAEANSAADYRHLLHRIEKLENKGKPEGGGVGVDK